jgi:two-component system, NtrC family, sensor kinase
MLKRGSIYLQRVTFLGGLGGALVGAAAWLLLPAAPLLRASLAAAAVALGYLVGALTASRRREISDVGYILRLREELRRCQDHIMQTATFQSLAAYIDDAAPRLREPLQRLTAGVQALAADAALSEEAHGRLAALQESSESLRTGLQHLAGYALTRPSRAPFSVNTLLREAIHLCRHRAEEKKIRFDERYGIVPPVFGPAGRIQQALQNLVINAVESMPYGGGTVLVETTMEGDRVAARIRDTGVGIRPEHLQRVFEPFFSTKPEKSGVGLGLWTSQLMLHMIGGEIHLASRPHEGTEVTVLFPRAAPLRPGRTGVDHPPELSRNTAEERGREIA